MANIRENKRDGKLISYRFTVCLGRDANNKQIRRYTTWDIPEGLTPAKAKKAAERAADAWEREEREEYQKEKELGEATPFRQRSGGTASQPLSMMFGFPSKSATATISKQPSPFTRT